MVPGLWDGTTPFSIWLRKDGANPFFYLETSKVGLATDKWGLFISFLSLSFSSSLLYLLVPIHRPTEAQAPRLLPRQGRSRASSFGPDGAHARTLASPPPSHVGPRHQMRPSGSQAASHCRTRLSGSQTAHRTPPHTIGCCCLLLPRPSTHAMLS